MPPRDDTHTDLVLGLQAGSTDAFERLYAEYHAAIYNLCARILCDREEAQDVTQDVFIKAFSRPPAADERLNLRAWLYRVATNACYNALRARTRHGGRGGETLDAVPAGVDEYERAQTAALVGQSLEQLNERYRTALVLKDLHGLPPAEIAAVLQVSRPAADVLVHRARASFRSVFRRLAGRDATAPASLGLVLLPLSVPAALHVMPPLPAARACRHSPGAARAGRDRTARAHSGRAPRRRPPPCPARSVRPGGSRRRRAALAPRRRADDEGGGHRRRSHPARRRRPGRRARAARRARRFGGRRRRSIGRRRRGRRLARRTLVAHGRRGPPLALGRSRHRSRRPQRRPPDRRTRRRGPRRGARR